MDASRSAGPLVEILDEQDAPLLAKPFFAGGDPGPIAGTLAHVPELIESALQFIGGALSLDALDVRTREIAIVRTSTLLSCRYCIDAHTPAALDAGLSHAAVRALRNEVPINHGFSDAHDLALIEWVDAVAGGRGPIADDISARVRRNFTDATIVELTLLVATTMLLNRYATALRLPVGVATQERLTEEGW
jgi:AhpD family alkylhydroperoxidase